jgi:DNA-binding beta-propeller fold protein YncE
MRGFSIALLLCLSIALGACNDDGDQSQPDLDSHDDGRPPEAEAPPMHAAAHDDSVRAPMDATPSPDGERVFYTALDRSSGEDVAGVFSVDAAGGEIQTLALGAPLAAPVGVTIDLAGERLFVADPAAISDDSDALGALIAVDVASGEMSVVDGTQGFAPRGVVVAKVDGRERLFFTGADANGAGGVFRVATAGGTPERVSGDAELHDPSGVAVTDDGTIYVVDALADASTASLVRIGGADTSTLAAQLGVGFPAGVAVNRAGDTVLVSGLDPRTRRDLVYVVNAQSGELAVVSEPLADFAEPAGLHRAHEADVFAWADSEADGAGTVYVLEL